MDEKQTEVNLGNKKSMNILLEGTNEEMGITTKTNNIEPNEILAMIPHVVTRLVLDSIHKNKVSLPSVYRACTEIGISSAEHVMQVLIENDKKKATPIKKKRKSARKASKKK